MDKAEMLIMVTQNSLARYLRELDEVQTTEELWKYNGMIFVDLWTFNYLTDDTLKTETLKHSLDEAWKRAQKRVYTRLYNSSTN